LATLWPVADLSTSVLMTDLYHGKAEQGLATAAALQQAQLGLLHGRGGHSPWRHPFYWAPFVLLAGSASN
ncbi:MAG TPA: CHAT domain-containing protein, partial [Povalibacter sp.]|nr:CHAT domain-containing protein [Povalibacter sp.]